ncbi:MAG: glutamyl-tRNA reductase [Bacteroidota bacterium]
MANLRDYRVITLTHRHMRIHDLASFVLNEGASSVESTLTNLKAVFGLDELYYLNTCNRILFLFTSKHNYSEHTLRSFFNCLYPSLSESKIELALGNCAYLEGEEAVMHMFKVASSIDSLVIGEREILRQMREAYEKNKAMRLTGDNIRLLMRITVETAKKVYAVTRIGEKPLSVVSLAMQKLRQRVQDTNARFVLVGAGQTMELVCKFLKKREFTNITVFNRSVHKAKDLAALFEGKAYGLDALSSYQGGFDVLIVCTGATDPVITPEIYKALLNNEQTAKTVIDLALPNNVAAEAVEQFKMHYIQLEDLRTLAKANLAFRESEAECVRQILKQEVSSFETIFEQRQIAKAMSDVPRQVKAVKAKAMEKVFKSEINQLNDSDKALLERIMTYMEKKCISIPMTLAKETITK